MLALAAALAVQERSSSERKHRQTRRLRRRKQCIVMPFDQAGIEIRRSEGHTVDQTRKKGRVGRQTDDLIRRQGLRHPRERLFSVLSPDDQLGNHRIIKWRDRISLAHARIDPHRRTGFKMHRIWSAQMLQRTDRRQKTFFRIFCIDTCFDRMTMQR